MFCKMVIRCAEETVLPTQFQSSSSSCGGTRSTTTVTKTVASNGTAAGKQRVAVELPREIGDMGICLKKNGDVTHTQRHTHAHVYIIYIYIISN